MNNSYKLPTTYEIKRPVRIITTRENRLLRVYIKKIRCYGNPAVEIHAPLILKINYARACCGNASSAFISIIKFYILY